MTKLPEGRKPLPREWFIDRAKAVQPDNEWPQSDDFSDIDITGEQDDKRRNHKDVSDPSEEI